MSAGKDDLLARILIERDRLLLAVAGLEQAEALKTAVGEWSVKDIVSHIAAWEREAAGLLDLLATGRESEMCFIDQSDIDSWNAQVVARSAGQSWEEVLNSLTEARDHLLRALSSVTEEQMDAPTGGHGPVSEWLPKLTFEHEADHSAAILKWRSQEKN